jgi:hypothetical protein
MKSAITKDISEKNSLPNAIRKDKVGHIIVRDEKISRR